MRKSLRKVNRVIKSKFDDKREGLVYVVIVLWIFMGILSLIYGTRLDNVAAYFLSMSAFVGSFIFGESVRKSETTAIFYKGRTSRRELVVYLTMLLWLIIGVYGIVSDADLLSISAYFASLTPFVSAFVLGETYKPIKANELRPNLDISDEDADDIDRSTLKHLNRLKD